MVGIVRKQYTGKKFIFVMKFIPFYIQYLVPQHTQSGIPLLPVDSSVFIVSPMDMKYYKAPETKRKIRKSAKCLLYCNLAAGLLHMASFIAAITVTLVRDERISALFSTDFVRGDEVAGDEVLKIDLKSNTYQPVWMVVPIPLITSLFHLFIALCIPFVRKGYGIMTNVSNRNGVFVLDTYKRFSESNKLVTVISYPLSCFDYYTNVIALGINPLRWIEYSITASLMIVTISALSGVSNAFLLAFQAIPLNVALMWIGGNYFEQENIGYSWPLAGKKFSKRKRVKWRFFLWGFVFFLVQWAVVFAYFFTAITSADGTPAYVYVIVFGLFFNFNLFALNPLLHYTRSFAWISDFVNYELVFLALSFISKFVLDWTMIIGSAVNPRDIDIVP